MKTDKVYALQMLDYEGLKFLQVGDIRRYQAGVGRFRCEATVEVLEEPELAGVKVKITEIHRQGKASHREVGDEIIAGAQQLYKKRLFA